jgi:hypothetical protein
MVDPEDKSVTAMIAKMERKRAELLTELEKVQEWLSQVDAILNRGKAIIGEEFPSVPAPAPPTPSPDNEKPETKAGRILRLIEKPDAEKSHAEKIKKLFEELGGMSVPKIDAQFRERNWPINGKNRNQIIRNALHRKSEWFALSKDNKIWDLKKRIEQSAQAK